MTPAEVNELVNEALLKWAALKDIDVESPGKNLNWQDGRTLDELNSSREWDPTGITTFMMLRGMAEEDLKKAMFNAYQVIMDPGSIEESVKPMRELRAVLEDPRVVGIIEGFQDAMLGAAGRYGVDGERMEELEKLLEDKHALAYVRRDALASINKLAVHQFTQGDAGDEPKVNQDIYEFWNVNSLLLAIRQQGLSGITMVLMRDPATVFRTYFAFAIRNGGTITLLTDKHPDAHPAYERMARRPDRDFMARAEQHWFPYDLIKEVEASETETRRLYEEKRTDLVPINVKAVPVAKIGDLHPEQFVWVTLVLDLIRERFWKQNERLPQLSYTGQMVREPEALVGADGALARVHGYKHLELPPLGREDMTAEAVAEQWEREPTRFNAWLVDRYGGLVPEEVFNVVGEQGLAALPAPIRDLVPVTERWQRDQKDPFEALSPVSFGTKETLDKDRKWAARVNQMKAIQALADREYEKTKDSIKKWCQKRIEQNDELLLDAAAAGTLVLPSVTRLGFNPKRKKDPQDCLKQAVTKGRAGGFSDVLGNHWPYVRLANRGWDEGTSYRGDIERVRCYEDEDRPATIYTVIVPNCPAALAVVFDVPEEKLPWQLRNWYLHEPYGGNHILDRLDPEDWVLHNPWMPYPMNGPSFRIGIAISRTAANERRQKLGLPKKDWKSFIKDKSDGW